MNLMIIGAGGVGQSVAMIIKRAGREGTWAEKIVIADYNPERAKEVAVMCGDRRFTAEQVDAKNPGQIQELVKKHGITQVLNAVEPVFNETIFDACFECGAGYMDCAMTLSKRHPDKPFELVNVMLGDYQLARHEKWEKAGIMAVIGSGVEPGVVNVFARFAAKHLFDTIDEINIRDGDSYDIPGYAGVAFGFSVWTTIEECLNPPVIWEKDRGWYCTEPFSEPEIFSFPGGIGDVEVINVEHEEVVLIPRVIDCNRVTFKFGVPREMRALLLNLRQCGMDDAERKIKVGDSEFTPRDFLVKVVPNPLELAEKMIGKGCAGAWVTGTKDGLRRSVYLYQVSDNQECYAKYGTNSVVAQTAVGPVIMLELIARGIWNIKGVHGPESFDPDPFIGRMAKYEFPGGMQEKDSAYCEMLNRKRLLEYI